MRCLSFNIRNGSPTKEDHCFHIEGGNSESRYESLLATSCPLNPTASVTEKDFEPHQHEVHNRGLIRSTLVLIHLGGDVTKISIDDLGPGFKIWLRALSPGVR